MGRLAPLAGLEERGGLDVAVFQRRRMAQHRTGPRITAGEADRRRPTQAFVVDRPSKHPNHGRAVDLTRRAGGP